MLKDYCQEWKESQKNRAEKARTFKQEEMLIMGRLDTLHSEIMNKFPKEVEAQLWVYDMGTNVKGIIILAENAPPVFTTIAKRFITARYHKAERSFNTYDGHFSWRGSTLRKDEKGEYTETIEIQNADPGKCVVRTYRETITRYESNCEKKK